MPSGDRGSELHGSPRSRGPPGTVLSSRRYKEDIQSMDAASDGLLRLRPVTFRYKKPLDDGAKPIQYRLELFRRERCRLETCPEAVPIPRNNRWVSANIQYRLQLMASGRALRALNEWRATRRR